MTQTGNTARLIAKYRPGMPVLLLTATPEVAQQCNGYLKNTHCEVAPASLRNADDLIRYGIEQSKRTGWITSGDLVVAIHGSANTSFIAGSTRLLQIVTA